MSSMKGRLERLEVQLGAGVKEPVDLSGLSDAELDTLETLLITLESADATEEEKQAAKANAHSIMSGVNSV